MANQELVKLFNEEMRNQGDLDAKKKGAESDYLQYPKRVIQRGDRSTMKEKNIKRVNSAYSFVHNATKEGRESKGQPADIQESIAVGSCIVAVARAMGWNPN